MERVVLECTGRSESEKGIECTRPTKKARDNLRNEDHPFYQLTSESDIRFRSF
jgi:hypothetical protein